KPLSAPTRRTADVTSYSATGQTLHYHVTATNTGNTPLAALTPSAALSRSLACTPANGSSLAPGAALVCTASHTVVQADIDAGSYYNKAYVGDAAAGAAAKCADVTITASKSPALSIVKTAEETGYSETGQTL